jgi:hypothetical protein
MRNQELEKYILSVECDPKVNLIVPEKLKNPHPLVKDLNISTYSTIGYNSRTEKTLRAQGTIDLAVGKANLKRSELILDTFIKAVEARGNSFSFDSEGTYLNAFDEKIRIRFWEKSKYIDKPDRYGYEYREMELTGVLSIQYFKICNYVEREWADTPYSKLEEKLGRVIGSLEYYAKLENTERLAREKRWEEERIQAAKIKERNMLKESEFIQFKELLVKSQRWEMAQSMRAFVRFMQENVEPHSASLEVNEWATWAKEKIDWYDPTIAKPDALLNPFGEFHESLLNNKSALDRYTIDKL